MITVPIGTVALVAATVAVAALRTVLFRSKQGVTRGPDSRHRGVIAGVAGLVTIGPQVIHATRRPRRRDTP